MGLWPSKMDEINPSGSRQPNYLGVQGRFVIGRGWASRRKAERSSTYETRPVLTSSKSHAMSNAWAPRCETDYRQKPKCLFESCSHQEILRVFRFFPFLTTACSTRPFYYMRRISDVFRAEERGSFAPKYLRNLSTQAGKALIFVVILSRIEAGIKKVYNKITLVRLSQNSLTAVTN